MNIDIYKHAEFMQLAQMIIDAIDEHTTLDEAVQASKMMYALKIEYAACLDTTHFVSDTCPLCSYYGFFDFGSCDDFTCGVSWDEDEGEVVDDEDACPLYEEDTEPGSCCEEWRAPRDNMEEYVTNLAERIWEIPDNL